MDLATLQAYSQNPQKKMEQQYSFALDGLMTGQQTPQSLFKMGIDPAVINKVDDELKLMATHPNFTGLFKQPPPAK